MESPAFCPLSRPAKTISRRRSWLAFSSGWLVAGGLALFSLGGEFLRQPA
jgi:hypothetical protein